MRKPQCNDPFSARALLGLGHSVRNPGVTWPGKQRRARIAVCSSEYPPENLVHQFLHQVSQLNTVHESALFQVG